MEMIKSKVLLLIWTIYFLGFPGTDSIPVQNDAYIYPDIKKNLGGNELKNDVNNQVLYIAYRKAAIENGIDPDIVTEVTRTGKPSIKVENDEKGAKRTTTVKLQPDGSISRHTRIEHNPTFIFSTSPGSSFNVEKSSLPFNQVSMSQKGIDWEWNPSSVRTFVSEPSPSDTDSKWTSILAYNRGPQHPTLESRPEQVFPTTRDYKSKTEMENTRTVTNTLVGPTDGRSRTITLPWAGFGTQTTTKMPPIFFNYPHNNSLPNLDDFLKLQYATTTISPKDNSHMNPVLNNGKPLDSYTPISPQLSTETKTYTRTIETNGLRDISVFDPGVNSILGKAGIDPTELLAAPDNTITITRHEPDGKVITTKYSRRTVPASTNSFGADSTNFSTHFKENPQGPFFITQPTTRHDFFSKDESSRDQVPLYKTSSVQPRFHGFGTTPIFPENVNPLRSVIYENTNTGTEKYFRQNAIDEFLGKLNLNSSLIAMSNGELVKTIVDDKGRVLTASFVLSTVRNNEDQKRENAPIK